MKNFLLLAATTMVCLLLGEYVLRVAFPYKLRSINYQGSIAYEYDEDYLLRLKPHVKKSFYRTRWNGGEKINWQTNAHGFRGPELQKNPTHRIIVYGDSNIQARFSEFEHTYPEQLRQQLAASGFEAEVVNAGIIGMGPDQMLLKFQKEIEDLQPEVAIFNIFCDNDFGDIIRNRLFDVDESGKLNATSFPHEVDEYLQWIEKEKSKPQSLFLEESIALVNRIFGEKENPEKENEFVTRALKRCEEEYAIYESKQPKFHTHFLDHYEMDLALQPYGKSGQVKQQLMAAVLDSIYQFGQKHQVAVCFQLLPSAIDLTGKHIVGKKYLETLSADYAPQRLTDMAERICMENDIPFLNLYEVFENAGADDLYFSQDDHWNDKGQALAAKTMSTMLLQRVLFPSKAILLIQ